KSETLNLVAPAELHPLASEYERLTADLREELGTLDSLAGIHEDDQRKDITLLHQATQWDARLIALAATAGKLSKDTAIGEDALYALVRLGLPTDEEQLALVPARAVECALRKGVEMGIISIDDNAIAKALTAFETFSRKTQLASKAPGTLSSY